MRTKPQKYYSYRIDSAEQLPMTLDEIGESLGISKERVRQIMQSGMRNFERELKRRNIRMEDVFVE